MKEILQEIKESFREGSALTKLIYINLGVFLFLKIIQSGFFLAGKDFLLYNWLILPSNIDLLVSRPWTLISYMFLHSNILHIISNLLVLYWFGKIFLFYFTEDKLVAVYFLGGIAGAVTYLLAYNIFPAFEEVKHVSFLLGASASIIAILLVTAVYAPNREIMVFLIGDVKLKYIALFMIALYIVGITATNPGGNLAHLGGAGLGIIYALQLKKGRTMGTWIYDLLNRAGKIFNPGKKVKIAFKQQPPRDDYEYNRLKNYNQQEINRILDKIGKSGYNSLTKEEKELLFSEGNKK